MKIAQLILLFSSKFFKRIQWPLLAPVKESRFESRSLLRKAKTRMKAKVECNFYIKDDLGLKDVKKEEVAKNILNK